MVVDPEISSGLPLQGVHRWPPPGSRSERYCTPATKGVPFPPPSKNSILSLVASDVAQNPYWKRDVRRAYPQLSVVTQPGLSSLLLQHAESPA